MMMKETSQDLRMLSRSLSDCQTLTLNVNMQLALREPRVFHLWVAWYQVYSWRPTHQCCTNKYEVGLESVWPCWCLCYAHTAISEGRPIDHVWKLWQLSPVEEREGNTFIMLWRATKCVDIKEPLLRFIMITFHQVETFTAGLDKTINPPLNWVDFHLTLVSGWTEQWQFIY